MDRERVEKFVRLLFECIETVPVRDFHEQIPSAEAALGDVDPDDVLYLACALGSDAAIWSDDADFETQQLVPVYTTAGVVDSFETV